MPYQKTENPDTWCLNFDSNGVQSSAKIDLKGATVISWVVNGQEILFLSSKADRTSKKAIRGGIPLVFPQFGKVESPNPVATLPQHGFARISQWKLDEENSSEASEFISVSFSLDSSDLKEQHSDLAESWAYPFTLTYTVCLSAFSLSTTLKVCTTSEKELPITPLLHSYFATEDITQTFISGVKKGPFVDKTKSGAPTQEFSGEKIIISQEVDEIHFDAFGSDKVSLNFGSSVPYKLEFNSIELPDVVVWNPWIEKCIATQDLKDDDYLKFICVELGNIKKPFLLSSNSPLTFGQRISLVKVE
ncbi:hypothetical protein DSO57_1024412 [Entomophthora muscae]|uniref:Uncharacterized protein n=1 Tax=Entomophthora muscae TaxID=34485 RepID=A0ACC2U146_9FUNG|nr:hypothetical protein DSO57_1024412 [Entomophthora muscae]